MEMTIAPAVVEPVAAAAGFCFSDSVDPKGDIAEKLTAHLMELAQKGTGDNLFDDALDGYMLHGWKVAVADYRLRPAPTSAVRISAWLSVDVTYRPGREDPLIVYVYGPPAN